MGAKKEVAEKAAKGILDSFALGSTIKKAGKTIKKTGLEGRYVESAIRGALGWGAVGGVTEWAQGGSFFGGAASNLLPGAAMGAGYKAIKVGATGADWKKSSIKDIGKGYKDSYSKSVIELERLAKNMNKQKI